MRFSFLALLLFYLTPSIALSYVGPGMGGGAIAIVFGIFLALFFGLIGVFYYPIKKILRKNKNALSNKRKKS